MSDPAVGTPRTGTPRTGTTARAWYGSVSVGTAVLLLGVLELFTTPEVVGGGDGWGLVVLVLAAAVAAGLARHLPAAALALCAATGVLQLATGTQVMLIEAALFVVVFAAARWGHVVTVVAAAVAVPAAAALAVHQAIAQQYVPLLSDDDIRALLDTAERVGNSSSRAGITVFVMLLVAAPWLAGVAFRFGDRARASKVSQVRAEESAAVAVKQSEQAQEIARLREEQARLARDVHDVVGHSLAVILAQAESAQYLPDDDPARLKLTMATIAGSARASLQDVRQVLSQPDGPAATRPLDTLVDGVRAGGHEVVLRELGTARPLPPELEVTAYRVLQEMLTNAVRHGRRDEPVFVERHWPDDPLSDDLRLEVRNTAGAHGAGTGGRGSGLDGMRDRLAAVGGRIDVRRREDGAATTFTVTAWLPLGPR